ncbi:hypothetical protein D6817_00350 [Candidatus Pacearchaeota archaeon]|nr:MAG: hypothetical protein D6817_00350 [Candidatus Pacearchaeota archaeon]
MKIKFLSLAEKSVVLNELYEEYGIEKDELAELKLIASGRKKIRAYSGDFSEAEVSVLSSIAEIDSVGLYLANTRDKSIRLNFDAATFLRDKLKKHVVELDENELKLWFEGFDLEKRAPKGNVVLKFRNDVVGVGKSNGTLIFNYVPKERKCKVSI